MTRINVGIDPKDLNGKMLIAEHREIKRIPNVIKSGRFSLSGQPESFTLGKGHVKFFYTRIAYLKDRYRLIYQECIRRGYNVTDFSSAFEGIDEKYMGNFYPTKKDVETIMKRIVDRLAGI